MPRLDIWGSKTDKGIWNEPGGKPEGGRGVISKATIYITNATINVSRGTINMPGGSDGIGRSGIKEQAALGDINKSMSQMLKLQMGIIPTIGGIRPPFELRAIDQDLQHLIKDAEKQAKASGRQFFRVSPFGWGESSERGREREWIRGISQSMRGGGGKRGGGGTGGGGDSNDWEGFMGGAAIGGESKLLFGKFLGKIVRDLAVAMPGTTLSEAYSLSLGASKPYTDALMGAYSLERAGGFASNKSAGYTGVGLLNSMTNQYGLAPEWMRKYGIGPMDALQSIQGLGVLPRNGEEALGIAKTSAMYGRAPSFIGMPQGTVTGILNQGLGLGQTNLQGDNVKNYISMFEKTLGDAIAYGMDRSKILDSLSDTLERMGKTGVTIDSKALSDLYMRMIGISGSTTQAATSATQIAAGVGQSLAAPFQNPITQQSMMGLIKGNNNLSTESDIIKAIGYRDQSGNLTRPPDMSQAEWGQAVKNITSGTIPERAYWFGQLAQNSQVTQQALIANAAGVAGPGASSSLRGIAIRNVLGSNATGMDAIRAQIDMNNKFKQPPLNDAQQKLLDRMNSNVPFTPEVSQFFGATGQAGGLAVTRGEEAFTTFIPAVASASYALSGLDAAAKALSNATGGVIAAFSKIGNSGASPRMSNGPGFGRAQSPNMAQ